MSELNLPTIAQLETAWNEGKPFEWRGKDGKAVDTKNRPYVFYPTPTPREDVFCYEAQEFTNYYQIVFWKKEGESIRFHSSCTLCLGKTNCKHEELQDLVKEIAEKKKMMYR